MKIETVHAIADRIVNHMIMSGDLSPASSTRQRIRDMIVEEMAIPQNDLQAEPFRLIREERARQFAKWGNQLHRWPTWMCILMEEVGELSEAILHEQFGGPHAGMIKEELVQTAAVAVQMLELFPTEEIK